MGTGMQGAAVVPSVISLAVVALQTYYIFLIEVITCSRAVVDVQYISDSLAVG